MKLSIFRHVRPPRGFRWEFRPAQKGQSLMEFAISITLLLILVSGVVDGSRALFTFLSMRDAAEEGALYASYNPATTDDAATRLRVCGASNIIGDLCSSDNPNDGSGFEINIQPTTSGKRCQDDDSSGRAYAIQVTVHYPDFPLTMPFIGVFIGGNSVPITASVNHAIMIPKCP